MAIFGGFSICPTKSDIVTDTVNIEIKTQRFFLPTYRPKKKCEMKVSKIFILNGAMGLERSKNGRFFDIPNFDPPKVFFFSMKIFIS